MTDREGTAAWGSNHYEILGLDRTCTIREVWGSYRRLALRYHPDRNPGEEAAVMFMRATEAYEVLSDPGRRRRYDEDLRAGRKTEYGRTATAEEREDGPRARLERAMSSGWGWAPPGLDPVSAFAYRILGKIGELGDIDELVLGKRDDYERRRLGFA